MQKLELLTKKLELLTKKLELLTKKLFRGEVALVYRGVALVLRRKLTSNLPRNGGVVQKLLRQYVSHINIVE